MKKMFPGYYRPSEKEFSELWKTCIFAFDANVLLNLYRYTPETKASLLAILEKVKDRIWLPYQAAFEYHNNRLGVVQQQMDAYDDVIEIVRKSRNDLKGKLNGFVRHPSIQIPEILQPFSEALEKFEGTLITLKENHPDFRIDDPIKDAVTDLFDGKIGEPTLELERVKIFKEGEDRYKFKRPPGYEDQRKGTAAQYGDLVMWFQIIAKARESKRPIILVTDDRKEDWWLRSAEGRIIGPRPELVQEFFEQATVRFYMYSADPFMSYATKHLKQKVEKKAIDEVRELRRRDEQSNRVKRTLMSHEAAMRMAEAFETAKLMTIDSSANTAKDAVLKLAEEINRAQRTLTDRSSIETAMMNEEAERAKLMMLDSSAYVAEDAVLRLTEEIERAQRALTDRSSIETAMMNEKAERAKLMMLDSSAYTAKDVVLKLAEEIERAKRTR